MDENKVDASGYEEISHTADWALRIWAPDLPALFATAAQGMYALMDVRASSEAEYPQQIHLEAIDDESLLVTFLTELLFLLEEGLVCDRFDFTIGEGELSGVMLGSPLTSYSKEIKAVTYHNLAILASAAGREVTVVFDV